MEVVIEEGFVEGAIGLVTEAEELDRWKELVSELGLAEQEKLVNKGSEPVSFRCMSNEEWEVYKAVLPTEVGFADYGRDMIPIRVLELGALAARQFEPDWLKIRYTAEGPDPILYAMDPGERYSANPNRYLIARWGEVLLSFSELRKRAKEILVEKSRASLMKAKTEIEIELQDLEGRAEKVLSGDYVRTW